MSQNTRDSELSVYKVIVLGQSGVGKSNIISRFVYDRFQAANNITIGFEFVSKIIQASQQQVNLQIWDTAGQERFRSVNKVFYKNALGALVVFSLICKQSFVNLSRWLKQIRSQIEQNAVLILVGNKSDLKQRQVSVAEAMKFAKQENMAYIETSAALNLNIEKCFQMLTSAIIAKEAVNSVNSFSPFKITFQEKQKEMLRVKLNQVENDYLYSYILEKKLFKFKYLDKLKNLSL